MVTHDTKGIHYLRSSGKWRAQISIKHVTKYIGTYSTSEEASAAYQIVRIELGDFTALRDDDGLERLFQAARKRASKWLADAGYDVDPADSKSPQEAKGYYQLRDNGKWVARISINGASKHIGTFSTTDGASAAYHLVSEALRDRRGRDSAELEGLFQAAKKKANKSIADAVDGADGWRPQKAKGCYQRRDNGRWVAVISINGANRHIGSFATSDEASAAYKLVRDEVCGTKRDRDGAELEASFQVARKKARGES